MSMTIKSFQTTILEELKELRGIPERFIQIILCGPTGYTRIISN